MEGVVAQVLVVEVVEVEVEVVKLEVDAFLDKEIVGERVTDKLLEVEVDILQLELLLEVIIMVVQEEMVYVLI